MVDLATHSGEGPVNRGDIASRQEISPDYVAQLFRPLTEAGLVEGVMGPGGGYRLARDAASITALDVVRTVEGPIVLVQCVDPDDGAPCHRLEDCVTHRLWRRLSETMIELLGSITLEKLREEALQLQSGASSSAVADVKAVGQSASR
jgi:Rrf2 family protein